MNICHLSITKVRFVSVFRIEIMANRTLKDAPTIKGTNPQYLIEKIIRSRIYDCRYWKEDCFALTGKIRSTKEFSSNDEQ